MLRDIRRIFEITKILGILRHLRRRVDKMYNGNMDRLFIILYIYIYTFFWFIYLFIISVKIISGQIIIS